MAVFFGHPHPRQVKNMIKWLSKTRDEIDAEIKRLQSCYDYSCKGDSSDLARDALMRDLISEKVTPVEAEKRLVQMGYDQRRVKSAQHLLRLSADRRRRVLRDEEIVRRYLVNHETPAALSSEYDLCRAQIHRIIKNHHIRI